MTKQIVEVVDGRIRWSRNLSCESELREGFYVFDESHGVTGNGPDSGPFASEAEAEAEMQSLGD